MIIYKCDYCHDEFDTLEEYQADIEKCKKRFSNVYNIYCYHYTYSEFSNEIHNYGVRKEEMLLAQANIWELRGGGLSGRSAQQFIHYILGKEESIKRLKESLEKLA